MNNTDAKIILQKGIENTIALSNAFFGKTRESEIAAHLESFVTIRDALYTEKQYQMLSKLMSYATNIGNRYNPFSQNNGDVKIDIEYAMAVFNETSVYPFSIVPFISKDTERNKFLIENSLRTDAHELIVAMSAPWKFISAKLARNGDTENWIKLIDTFTHTATYECLSESAATISEFDNLPSDVAEFAYSLVAEELPKTNINENHSADSKIQTSTLLALARSNHTELASKMLALTGSEKITLKDAAFKLITLGVDIGEETAIETLDRVLHFKQSSLSSDKSSALSFIYVCSDFYFSQFDSHLRKRATDITTEKDKNHLMDTLFNIIKYYKSLGTQGVIPSDSETFHRSMNSLIGTLFSMCDKSNIREIENKLVKYCKLSREEYFSVNEFFPHRRKHLENDLSI